MKRQFGLLAVAAPFGFMGASCAAPLERDTVPEVALDGLTPEVASVWTTDQWVLTANKPGKLNPYELGNTTTTFTNYGGATRTHRGGGCVVKRDGASSCTTDASCGTGALGYRYCMQADGDTAKRCYAKVSQDWQAYCQQAVLFTLPGGGGSTNLTISSQNWEGAGTYYNLSVISEAGNCTPETCWGCAIAQEDPSQCRRTLSAGTSIVNCGVPGAPKCP